MTKSLSTISRSFDAAVVLILICYGFYVVDDQYGLREDCARPQTSRVPNGQTNTCGARAIDFRSITTVGGYVSEIS